MISIRPATAADANAVGALIAEFQAYLRGLGDPAEFDFGAAKFARDGFGNDPMFESLVAETASSLVGYLLWHIGYDTDKGRRIVHVIDLYVTERFRRRGVGTELMRRAAADGRARGAGAMIWSVYKPNEMAARFYEKLGARYLSDLRFMALRIEDGGP